MSGVITTSNHPKGMWPGIHAWFGRHYNHIPAQYKGCFETEKSGKKYEEDVELTGFGLAPVKTEGGGVAFDSETQGPTTRYTHVSIGLGYMVTLEEREDQLYPVVSKKRSKALAFSMMQTKETIAANVYNRAVNPAYVGGDGQSLLSTAHPTTDGTQSNMLGTPADLSEAALEAALIEISQMKNSRGLRINAKAKELIIPSALQFDAERILKSNLRVGSELNDVNAIKNMGLLPGGIHENRYLTNPKTWFIKTDIPDGMRHFERRKLVFTKDNDFHTDNALAKATERYSFGWTDWRAIFGSQGT